MTAKKLLIANRGEIAIRVIEAASELGFSTVAIFSADDSNSLHTIRAEEAHQLPGAGVAAYLDGDAIIAIARRTNCVGIHPGYGFLSENAAFARCCDEAAIKFIGPRADLLELFGDKVRARVFASKCGVPVIEGSAKPTSRAEAQEFFDAIAGDGGIVIKAVLGGGGRGMRVVRNRDDLDEAYQRCQSEARAAFGNRDLYVERFMPAARHVEVQILGDRAGNIAHLWERECTIQRRHQKLIEVAPSPGISEAIRTSLLDAAMRIARAARYESLGTFEFLVDTDGGDHARFVFIEANPRLQVEHTVTEEVTGVDLVRAQIEIAFGSSLIELGLSAPEAHRPTGFAIELRINAETIASDGSPRPAAGAITVFEPPAGPSLRVDSAAYAGYAINPRFDSLLAKLIVHSSALSFPAAVNKAYRALCKFRIEGPATNLGFLQALLAHPAFATHRIHTGFVEEMIAELAATTKDRHRRLYFERTNVPRVVGAKIDARDPLAVLAHGKSDVAASDNDFDQPLPTLAPRVAIAGPEGTFPVAAPMQGTIVSVDVAEGESVTRGQQVAVMEAMKMEHVIAAPVSGILLSVTVAKGDTIAKGHPLAFIEEREVDNTGVATVADTDLEVIRPDLAEVLERHEFGLDAARPEAVARRRKTGQRTARENVEDLCDSGSFVEYGALGVAAQRRRRTMDDLIRNTPADGMITGHATINADLFGAARAHCAVLAYDFTVLAGTQGHLNHRKKDRMFQLARELRLPLILFAEGGGGRPGDTDGDFSSRTFFDFPRLSGLVPMIGIVSGRCFAGNASLLGCCDVVIATSNSNIGMGGPAMIESGGLGVFRPEEVGPINVQMPSGVVDIAVRDEAEAVRVTRTYLAYFQGAIDQFECADQRILRKLVPENRLRAYDVRGVIDTLADIGSVLELRPHFGRTTITALVRIAGRPIGLVANNPMHLAGAIDSAGADKAARFIVLCDAFDLPLLYLCDTPGIMVGPEVEKTALVRHSSRMMLAGANVSVPFLKIVLRKAYGLGAIAMSGGADDAAVFTVSWPTGEFGPMALEGAAKLGYRNELAAINEPAERKKKFDEMVAGLYQRGKALNIATHFSIDDVIDPADSRRWITSALRSTPAPAKRISKKYPFIDSW
ncbi:MAG TPA: carboxyl transferase domain-containing protein [Candidatus Binataceae bacterium]|nr:carboxyl transferase domain-containing protein [Candidatus Binataceae bacterium]